MSTIHIVSSGKGAAGKSLFASLLGAMLKNYGHDVRLVDADPQKQALITLYGDEVIPITLGYDPELEEMPMVLLSLANESDCQVVADLAADTDVHINRWLETCDILAAGDELGLTVVKWWVGDGDLGSLRELANGFTKMPKMKHVLVKNLARAREGKWAKAIAQSPEIQNAIANGLESIELPKLFGTLAVDFREAGITWETVMSEHDKKAYKRTDMISCGTANRWLKTCRDRIASVYPLKKIATKSKVQSKAT